MANREQRDEQWYGRSERDPELRGAQSEWDDARNEDERRGGEGGGGGFWRRGDERERVFGNEGRYGVGGRNTEREPWSARERSGSRSQQGRSGGRDFGGAYGSGGGTFGGAGRRDARAREGGGYGHGGRGRGGARGFDEGYGDLAAGGYGEEGSGSASGRSYGSYDESGEYGSRSRDWSRDRGFGGERRAPNARGEEGGWQGLTERVGRMLGRFTGRGPKGYQRSDERIREDVCDRLMEAGEIDASNLTVEVRGGEVVLEGSVDSKEAKRFAEDIAEDVSGVREVQNRLRIERNGNERGPFAGGLASDVTAVASGPSGSSGTRGPADRGHATSEPGGALSDPEQGTTTR